LWIYLVAQGATAFELVSGIYWLGLAPALAIEVGEVAALILWTSEAKSEIKSWQSGAVLIAAMAILLGKSAGERFTAWQVEFRQWKIAETEWKLAEEKQTEQLEYERKQEEERRDYRRKQREKRERQKAEKGEAEKREIQPTMAKAQEFDAETLSDAYKQRLKPLDEHLQDGKSVSSEEAFIIMEIGKSQGYRILSAAHSAGLLEKSGRKWKRGNGIRKGTSDEIPAGIGTA